jgi:kinesin family protein 13
MKEHRDKEEVEKQKNLELKQKSDKRAPHLTNLNEDIQLTGKMYYSLREEATYIGRHDGDPTPQIILRGVGI